ncbi:hypothetical protein M1466_01605 [Candidatus Dependentiae bacterium]|nr:hypothetical protein [Candidatus Dependentiae bacterium]
MRFLQQSLLWATLCLTIVLHGMAPSNTEFATIEQQEDQNSYPINDGILAGTLVKVPFGYTPIEELIVGDPVISRNEQGFMKERQTAKEKSRVRMALPNIDGDSAIKLRLIMIRESNNVLHIGLSYIADNTMYLMSQDEIELNTTITNNRLTDENRMVLQRIAAISHQLQSVPAATQQLQTLPKSATTTSIQENPNNNATVQETPKEPTMVKKTTTEVPFPIQIAMTNEEEYIDDRRRLRTQLTLIDAEDTGQDLAFYNDHFATFDCWTQEMYQQQWREGLERIKTHDSSCLVAYIDNNCITTWALYKIGNRIHIQERILMAEVNPLAIDYTLITPANCYDYLIRPRREPRVSYLDGERIVTPEWTVTMPATTTNRQRSRKKNQ